MDTLLDANWGLLWATIASIGVTSFYAIQTWKLVRVPFLPSPRARFVSDRIQDSPILKLQIIKIGVGIATDITVEYSLKGVDDNIRTERIELLSANKNRILDIDGLPPIPNDHYSEHKVNLKLKLKHRDVLGKKYRHKGDLDVSAEESRFN
jgi:hypothetical protein